MFILNHIVEFDQKYCKSIKYKIVLLDLELAFKLLDNANLNYQQ